MFTLASKLRGRILNLKGVYRNVSILTYQRVHIIECVTPNGGLSGLLPCWSSIMLKLVVHEHVGGLRSLLGHYQLRQLLKLIKFAFHPEDGRWVLASGSAFPERAQP
jgi:hypothetical protein